MSFPTFEQRCYQAAVCTIYAHLCIIYVHYYRECGRNFEVSLTKVASVDSKAESEPHTSTSADPSGSSSHMGLENPLAACCADYTRLMMQVDMSLTMG